MTPSEIKLNMDTNLLVIPEWYNKDYIENFIQLYKNDKSIKIHTFKNIPAIGKGENYGGILIRSTIQYTSCNSSNIITNNFIAKISFENDSFAMEKMKDYDIFNRELDIYKNILPKLQNYLNEIHDYDDNDNELFAKTIYIDYKNLTIIFEDLNKKSYIMADRTKGLDILHTKLVLKKLAKMHASSVILNKNTNGSLQIYDRGFFNRHTNSYSTFFQNTFKACGEYLCELDDELMKYYGKKIINLSPYLMEYGKRVFDIIPNELNVFVHGDFWINNIMFKYNNLNEPIDVIIIDFQYSCWGSPAIDLQYFFNTSLNEELRFHYQDELIQYYYYELSDTLKALKFNDKIPSLHKFHIDMNRKSFYALISTCVSQPVMINEETTDADFNSLMGDDEKSKKFKRTLFKNEKIQKYLKELLPIFDRRGLIDVV